MTGQRTHEVPNGFFGPNPHRPFTRPFWYQWRDTNPRRMLAVERAVRMQAARHEAELKAMLSMWVSELTPALVVGPNGHWLGLSADEWSHIGAPLPIIIPISAVRPKRAAK